MPGQEACGLDSDNHIRQTLDPVAPHHLFSLFDDLHHQYRWANAVPLTDSDDALKVNWCELTITDAEALLRAIP